ncbi:homeobox protein ceh-2-like [Lacerta agilis]|uniref:homeobox protein ceh-2-like n=1 Tax=Lacerta agilis TaxID=80427 RepID=UPI001419531B|nr:homeobox protein ceh-2-like [Lacerta agilis]
MAAHAVQWAKSSQSGTSGWIRLSPDNALGTREPPEPSPRLLNRGGPGSGSSFHASPLPQNPPAEHTEEGAIRMANTSFDGPGRRPLSLLVSREVAATLAHQTQPRQPLWHHPSRWDLLVPQRTKPTQRVADFSIRSILAQDGSGGERETHQELAEGASAMGWGSPSQGYTWMHCGRFKPPSVPKMKQTGCGPRPTSRSPRVPFSASQLGTLESSFQQAHYLSTEQVREVALLLGLTENRVKIWFQNRRARERRDFLKQHSTAAATPSAKETPLPGQPALGWH